MYCSFIIINKFLPWNRMSYVSKYLGCFTSAFDHPYEYVQNIFIFRMQHSKEYISLFCSSNRHSSWPSHVTDTTCCHSWHKADNCIHWCQYSKVSEVIYGYDLFLSTHYSVGDIAVHFSVGPSGHPSVCHFLVKVFKSASYIVLII